jgi:hypothetical protein
VPLILKVDTENFDLDNELSWHRWEPATWKAWQLVLETVVADLAMLL